MSSKKTGKRHGFTTGTCAAAAAKAAAEMLLTGRVTDKVRLHWRPSEDQWMDVEFVPEKIERWPDAVRCGVRKDAGDDIDVTDGLLICAEVCRIPDRPDQDEKESTVSETEEESGEMPDVPEILQAKILGQTSDDREYETEETGKSEETLGDLPDSEDVFAVKKPISLSDLEDDNGIIPLRWDKVADYFAPENKTKNKGNRFLTLAENGEFTETEWSLMKELFQAAGNPKETELPEEESFDYSEQERFLIVGGEGIGRVTKPGLDQPPGAAAINSGPRKMIREAVASVCDACEYEGRLRIEISVPGGLEIAARTFDPRLGIEGGISILGTTGIVESMSGRAVEETVRAEVRVKAAGSDSLVLVPGNTGAVFVRSELLIPEEKTVVMSNYPGAALDEAEAAGVKIVLLAGSLGKMIKLAGGVFYTHSRDADVRMDVLIRCAVRSGASVNVLRSLDSCVTTDAALDLLDRHGLLERTAELILNRSVEYVRHRTETLQIEMVILRNSGEVLAFTDNAFGIMMEE